MMMNITKKEVQFTSGLEDKVPLIDIDLPKVIGNRMEKTIMPCFS